MESLSFFYLILYFFCFFFLVIYLKMKENGSRQMLYYKLQEIMKRTNETNNWKIKLKVRKWIEKLDSKWWTEEMKKILIVLSKEFLIFSLLASYLFVYFERGMVDGITLDLAQRFFFLHIFLHVGLHFTLNSISDEYAS